MRPRDLVWRTVLIAGIMMMSCANPFGTDDDGGNGGGKINRKSPDALVNFFIYAYENKDLDLYDEALDDRFLFELDPVDAQKEGLPPDKPWWGKTEDMAITAKMFDPNFVPHDTVPKVISIKAEFAKKDNWTASLVPVSNGDTIDAFVAKFEPDMSIDVEYADKKTVTKLVNNSYVDIWVTQDLDHPGLWRIVKMLETRKSQPRQ